MTSVSTAAAPTRTVRLLFAAAALGEIGVGLLALAWPQVMSLLLAAPLDAGGLMVSRMLGAAIVALGATWWLARNDEGGLARNAVGFLIYNVVVGVLFAIQAFAAAHAALPWIVAIVHLGAATGFITLKPRGGTLTGKEQP